MKRHKTDFLSQYPSVIIQVRLITDFIVLGYRAYYYTEMKRLIAFLLVACVVVASVSPASAAGGGDGSHAPDSILNVLLGIVVVILAAKLGGDAFERFDQPAVLGELIFGILLGNLVLFNILWFQPFVDSIALEILAELGVLLLLFQVGLETTFQEMRRVGLTALLVAVFGVVAPFVLGFVVSYLFLSDQSMYVHIFIGATLCATSVGITARVLRDIGRIKTKEAQIILGAAVIDDILGLIILAVVVGIIGAASSGGSAFSLVAVLIIIGKALAFVVGALLFGRLALPALTRLAAKLRGESTLLAYALLLCFLFSYLAGVLGLAPIVGAFAAGLIITHETEEPFRRHAQRSIHELLAPLAMFLVPIFFVRMGAQVSLAALSELSVLGFAAVLTLAAIIGKQACALAVRDKRIDRLSVGLGMIPRGEVGLIFAGIGAKLVIDGHAVIAPGIFGAVIIMVLITTLVTPPLLTAALSRTRHVPEDETVETETPTSE